MGRIHLGRQDLDELQTRKMKGLKRSRDVEVDDGVQQAEEGEVVLDLEDLISQSDDDDEEGGDIDGNGVESKRPRLE